MAGSEGYVARTARAFELARCLEIRQRVFVDEQHVPPELEQDALDGACEHFLVARGGRIVGTARLRFVEGDAKAERVAVLAPDRRRGVGGLLMDRLEAEAAACGSAAMVVSAQEGAVAFYAARGYTVEGAGFVEAGIPHRTMRKALRSRA